MRQYILHVLLVALALTACSDFLDIKPYGKTIPPLIELVICNI